MDNANVSRLRQLTTDLHTYDALEYPGVDSKGEKVTREQMGRLLERLVVPKSIHLKVLSVCNPEIISWYLITLQGWSTSDVSQGSQLCCQEV